ncbi:MAG: AMP-binding protein [Caldisphaera sp.]
MIEKIYPKGWFEYKFPEIPERFNPIEIIIDKNAEKWKNKIALIYDTPEKSITYTYTDLVKEVSKASNVLVNTLGLRRRNTIMIISFDSFEPLSLWLGAIRANILPYWTSPLYLSSTIANFVKLLEPDAIFVDINYLNKLNEIPDDVRPKHIITLNGKVEEYNDYSSLYKNAMDYFEPIKMYKYAECYFLSSGGTTGFPKLSVHLATDFIIIPDAHGIHYWGWSENDINYGTSQKYFTQGMWPGILMPLALGGTGIISSRKLTADTVFHVLKTYKPTYLITVPTIIKGLIGAAEEGKEVDLSSVKVVYVASEKLPEALSIRFKELFSKEVFDTIGSSEITYEWIANKPGENKIGTVGKPIYGYDVKLVDLDTDKEITEPYKSGACYIKSPTVLAWYYRNPEKSRELIIGEWFRTGDVLYFDEEGFFVHNGRVDDQFKIHGMWASSQEIEEVIQRNPKIMEVGVTNIIGKSGLSVIVAAVVLKPSYVLDEKLVSELKESVKKELGGYKVPEIIKQFNELPRTALQKIDRKQIKKLFETNQTV